MILAEFMNNPGLIYKFINDHHQLRWLADGVNRMALGSIINALWDAWAKVEKKPMWKLLVDLSPQIIIDAIDWRYLEDALTKEEALAILNEKIESHSDIEQAMLKRGP
jgi:L-fuconate dehydratase